ncbi:MAG TPA: hypothetical protein VGG94_00355, partial [Chthoniobacterales bacterium]
PAVPAVSVELEIERLRKLRNKIAARPAQVVSCTKKSRATDKLPRGLLATEKSINCVTAVNSRLVKPGVVRGLIVLGGAVHIEVSPAFGVLFGLEITDFDVFLCGWHCVFSGLLLLLLLFDCKRNRTGRNRSAALFCFLNYADSRNALRVLGWHSLTSVLGYWLFVWCKRRRKTNAHPRHCSWGSSHRDGSTSASCAFAWDAQNPRRPHDFCPSMYSLWPPINTIRAMVYRLIVVRICISH